MKLKLEDDVVTYQGSGGIKKITLNDQHGEQMDVEEDAIKGLVNLGLKK